MTYELAKKYFDGNLKIETSKKLKFRYLDNDNNLISEEIFDTKKHILISLGFDRRLVPMDKCDFNKMATIMRK